jgi:hypothetical protein
MKLLGRSYGSLWYLLTTARSNLVCTLGRYFDHDPTSFFRIVRQQFKERSPGRIKNAFRKMKIVVLDHVRNLQVLCHDRAELFDVSVRDFVKKISALVAGLLVSFSD